MHPAWSNRGQQTYNSNLSDELNRAGAEVHEAFPSFLRFWRFDIFHTHWPNYVFAGRRGWIRWPMFFLLLGIHRVFGGRIVQTIHNLSPHDFPDLKTRAGMAFLDRITHGVVLHEPGVLGELDEARPGLRRAVRIVSDHPAYNVESSPADRMLRRAAWSVDDGDTVCLHFGMLRHYKGTADLVRAWTEGSPGSLLVCAGRPDRTVSEALSDYGDTPNIRLDLRLLSDRELQEYLSAADVAILPYRRVTTSGSLWHALSARVPVVMPRTPAALRAQQIAGDSWVMVYDGPVSPSVIESAIDFARRDRDEPPVLPSFAGLAGDTLALYRQLVRDK